MRKIVLILILNHRCLSVYSSSYENLIFMCVMWKFTIKNLIIAMSLLIKINSFDNPKLRFK